MLRLIESGTTRITPSYSPAELKHKVRVPAGKCPIRVSHYWSLPCLPPAQVLCTLFWEIREWGLRRGEFFMVEAIAYWIRWQLDVEPKELDWVDEVIFGYARLIGDPDIPANRGVPNELP